MLLKENTNLKEKEELQKYLQQIPEQWDSDIFIFSHEIFHGSVNYLIQEIKNNFNKRNNISLLLTTNGGEPDAAFRMAKFLKKEYNKFTIFVFGYCKSSGTLLALGANEIVMSDFGELGPLDTQVAKEGDLRRESGLNLKQSLKLIREEVPKIFKDCLLAILDLDPDKSTIPLKVMEDIAASIAGSLLQPILTQIDPARLGEIDRATTIAMKYGERLNPTQIKAIETLTSNYPSHSFVIDYDEASKLFGDCIKRPITEAEKNLERYLEKYEFDIMRNPSGFIGTLEELLTKDSIAEG